MTHRKKHSILSLLLALVMLFSAVSTTALAADASADEHIHTDACDHEETTIGTEAVSVDESSDESEPAVETADPYSGTIADSAVVWALDSSTGHLFITGNGDCPMFQSAGDQPWAAVRTQITEVWFNDMDTLSISNLAYWFDGCTALTTAEIPYTTPVIGNRAFANCPSLRTVLIYHENESLTICPGAFYVSGLTPLEVWYVPSSDSTAAVVTAYDWSDDNRAAWFEDVYGISLLASGYCSNCKGTYSYTVAYEPWTSTEHCIRHWCSNCGLDQCGGVNGGSHTYNNSGTCTKCGYYNSAYDNSVCYHTSTYTTWSGCNWYKYCSSCGTLVSSGTSHGTYVYGAWAYYSTTQHRRTATCSDCGQVSYSYGSHSTSTKYAQDSSTQHTVGSYCSTCGSYIGSLSYESHNFTYGAWTNYSATQHRRTATCSDCGYSTYEYANHSLSYGDWEINEGSDYSNTHKRTVSCSCGYSITEYEAHNCYGVSEWEYSDSTYHKRNEECECGYTRVLYTRHTHTTSYESSSDEAHNVIRTCATCGHSSTSTEAHSFSYESWTSSSDTHHQRSASCICGYGSVEYGIHADADDDGYCDDCTYLMTRFSVTVPANLSLTVSKNGEVYAATTAQIVNNSTGAVCVTSVKLSAENDWQLVPYSTNMADEKVDSKRIGFSLNGAESDGSAMLPVSSWVIAKNSVLSLDYDAVVSATSNPINEQVLTVVFVLNWAVV